MVLPLPLPVSLQNNIRRTSSTNTHHEKDDFYKKSPLTMPFYVTIKKSNSDKNAKK